MGEETVFRRRCPCCGALLPEEAAFCPHCARSLNRRTVVRPPNLAWLRWLRAAAALLVLAIVAGGLYLYLRPRTWDAQGEVLYTDADGTYQVVLAWPNSRFRPAYTICQRAEVGVDYRFPVRLYVNYTENDASANERFLEKVEWVTAEFLPPEGEGTATCLEPEPDPDYAPDAALVSYVDFTARENFTAQMVWTIRMKNGDTICLRQDLMVEAVETYDYYPEDYPMQNSEELQALVNQIAASTEPWAVVNIHLPAVTYTGSLVLQNRSINFYGSAEGERRTTFAGPVRLDVSVERYVGWICYFENIDFQGSGDGVGLSTAVDARATNCAFSGWKTGMLGYGSAWVNVIECTFEDNAVGFHFNSTGSSANHSMYNDNLFRNNGTAVLLENVPTELELDFSGSVFADNGIDIDNRCGHAADISEAVFQ